MLLHKKYALDLLNALIQNKMHWKCFC